MVVGMYFPLEQMSMKSLCRFGAWLQNAMEKKKYIILMPFKSVTVSSPSTLDGRIALQID